MPTTQQLIEQRASAWDKAKEILSRATDDGLSAEDSVAYDAAEADVDRLGEQIERQQRHDERARSFDAIDRSGIPGTVEVAKAKEETHGERYERAFGELIRNGLADLEPEDKRAVMAGFRDPKEMRALGVGTASAGGYTVPPGFRDTMVETMKSFGGMLQVAEILTTDSGANLQWPTNDDTGNVGAILAENTQVTEQDFSLGTNALDAYMYTSKLVRVSLQLLQDSAFDVETWLARKLGERIGRILNAHFTTGTGTSQPDGIVTGATVGKQGATGQTTTVTYDDLIDLIDSLDPAYQGNAQWMLSQAARKSVRKLKDTQGRPLWEPSVQAGAPDVLLGYGYTVNQDMPAPAASAKSILFGDFKQAYVVRLVSDVTTLRLAERYADYLQVGFLAFQRADGTVQNSAAVKSYQNSAT